MELSILIPTYNEASNVGILCRKVWEALEGLDITFEIIIADAGSCDNTLEEARKNGCRTFVQETPGYGGALKEAVKIAQGKYIITMDADLSHNPSIIRRLFALRKISHIVIASRYIKGGFANMTFFRKGLSRILNKSLSWGLSLPVLDISSGFRLYNSAIFKEIDFNERDFSVLVEILVKAYMNGFSVREAPFHYQPRFKGKSQAKIFKFGLGFLRTFFKMWKMRNSIGSADYDDRAFNSRIPLQRYWQRSRYAIIRKMAGFKAKILDIGCGSAKILGAFPQAVGVDIDFKKLRYDLTLGNPLVNADLRKLSFKDGCFDVVICSEVIEHVKEDEIMFMEMSRVLKTGGALILGTPDYSRWRWRLIEWLYKKIIPGGYADEHISHYEKDGLIRVMRSFGFKLERYEYILGSELICKFQKLS